MPRPPLPTTALDLVRRAQPAVMAVVRPDGSPVTAATWFVWEDDDSPTGGHLLVNLEAGRKRLEHLRGNPQVSLTVLDDDWYTHVTLLGRVVELRDDADLSDTDLIARHYTGHAYPVRDRPRVTARIDVDRWTAWGALRSLVDNTAR
ncbi:PPOX class F420-dependent oxidoreductase [Isoptericola hypogeus]|uniref:PPOX class F420-dependent oxidoreductase n=1 Tax=Isoptericola hypogeus TaxID=300179 RepID=A0ABP4VTN6_9MICO